MNKLPATITKWNRRAAQIRRGLPKLLWGGAPPSRPRLSHRVVAEGKEYERWEQQRWEELERLYPGTRQSYGDILLRRHSRPRTWTTQLIEYAGWQGHPPQRAVLRIPYRARRRAALFCLHGPSVGLQLGCVEMAYLAEPLTE